MKTILDAMQSVLMRLVLWLLDPQEGLESGLSPLRSSEGWLLSWPPASGCFLEQKVC